MNYYRRYIGDHLGDTMDITLLEEGIYTRLTDYSYSKEVGLPKDLHRLASIVRARKPTELRVIEAVLSRFFYLGDDELWHHKRIEKELEAARPAIEAARRNGQRGARHKKTQPGAASDSQRVSEHEADGGEPPNTNPQPPEADSKAPEARAGRASQKRKLPVRWWESNEGVMKAGQVLGIYAKVGESMANFKARVEAAASDGSANAGGSTE